MPGNRFQQQRSSGSVIREGANLIQRAGKRHETVARDAAVRGLEADDSTERGGLANRAARVAPERKAGVPGCNRGGAATARATDALSTISEVAYSVDDGPWRLAGSADEIFDDQSELLQIDLPKGLASGSHTLAIRVADSAGNVGSSTTSFRIR